MWFALIAAAVAITPALSTPRASASPAAQSTTAWTGSYYANPDLQGDPAFTREDASIDFGWGEISPGGGIPASDFSARWTRWVSISTPGEWKFTTITDGGVRLFIDDNLVIDGWSDQATSARTVALNLTQSFHLVKMEYAHHSGNAEAHLIITSASYPDWRGEYFDNPDLVGAPVFVRNDSAIHFDFGTAGPGGKIPGTNFSVRWTGLIISTLLSATFLMSAGVGSKLCGSTPIGISVSIWARLPATFCAMSARNDSVASTLRVGLPAVGVGVGAHATPTTNNSARIGKCRVR